MLKGMIILLFVTIGFNVILPTIMNKIHKQVKITKTKENFVVSIPRIVFWIGAVESIVCWLVMTLFTVFSDPDPHWIFYITFGLFSLLGLYLVVRTVTFRVVVKGDLITVYSALRRPYSFRFNEIVFVKRQVKQTYYGQGERMIIKAKDKKRVIVESSEISYFRMLDKIKNKVSNDLRTGF